MSADEKEKDLEKRQKVQMIQKRIAKTINLKLEFEPKKAMKR